MKFYTQRSGSQYDILYKFLLVLKITTTFLFIGLFQVSASSYGQQRVILNQKYMTIRSVFKEIKRQTGYDVLWQGDRLDIDREVKLTSQYSNLNEIMSSCLKDQRLFFKIIDKSIIIEDKPTAKIGSSDSFQQDSVIYRGKVLDENDKILIGATVKVKGGMRTTFTTAQGNFSIYSSHKGSLIISYLGYLTKEITLSGLDPKEQLRISLVPGTNNLGEVSIVSTGYQDIAKERATGSFEVITKEQLQHSTDPNLLKRLDGITTSMNFNNQLNSSNSATPKSVNASSPLNNLTIRGLNTLTNSNNNASGVPLVVIDGIASPYSIDLINPDDVESITILKDAASASIWGSRAANGVIVVKTKKGGYDRPINVSFNANYNVTENVNLFYTKLMSTSDYIDAEVRRFNNNNVNVTTPVVGRPQRNISPVDEVMGQLKLGQITSAQANSQLDALRGNDIRKDFTDYFLRNSVAQNYSLSIDGGNKYVAYRLSGNYNKTLNNTQNSDLDRAILNYSISAHPVKNLELTGMISYTGQHTNNQAANNSITGVTGGAFYPYTRLVDDQGNPISVMKTYRQSWVNLFQNTYGDKVLNLNYVPLEDINEGYYKTYSQNLNLGLNAAYRITPNFSANIIYNYDTGRKDENTLYRQNSFYMRDLINQFTDPTTFIRNIPLGGQLSTRLTKQENQTLRGQLNFNKTWNGKHAVSAIAGIDVSQNFTLFRSDSYYGYDENMLTSNNNLNYTAFLNTLYTTSSGIALAKIPLLNDNFSNVRIRTISSYSNAAYTYDRKYTISGSIRRDQSSEFGEGSNKGGTPFWSTGISWNINNEGFYNFSLLPHLQLRLTYGYNGNTNPSISALPSLTYSNGNVGANGLPYASPAYQTVTNLQLRPEKTGLLNIGLDFGSRNNRISGSIEYYDKKTSDLLAQGPIDPTTGYDLVVYNAGNIHGWGTDMTLNTINIQDGKFSWTSNFLFSYNRVKLTKLYTGGAQTAASVVFGTGTGSYNVGYDLSRVFAFRSAGLDPATGDPRGYLNGQAVSISGNAAGNTAFTAIENSSISSSSVKYFGSSVPVYYGSLRNTFSYGRLSLSINLQYKLGYYFVKQLRTGSVRYSDLFNSRALEGAEYNQRWQNPGDQLTTNVPSLTFPISSLRDDFYSYSDTNVLKGDHVRLQEMNLSYGFGKRNWFVKNPRLYFNVSNLGVIWRANKLGIDPDTYDYPIPRSYGFGFSANF